ncbi:hypothetical protein SCO11_11370 [Legionella pneumophila serogroup 1]|uniref:DUF1845 domain-containing protein n=1 Tax=Legionella pneumophila TaxID=446 RepID=A0AAN5Q4A1_LEGPN|nr:hypothetical protein [Legionella pneumophila]AMV14904.1 hypothetical protein ULM_22390 [Legionella pneumophila]ANN93083.1 hypothetical protein A9P85_10800 [Legionella pneumophila]MCH9061595.1 hypothetical protein [Legionella pneumophila serogroup 1]MCH9064385.1 hypothetical protein [Legionella pneumophila serogroup 1]MCH9066797.1 hypothetical protein [Legionella pneumophila serogroup 1]
MKAEITLNLRTREVHKLFERKIRNDTLFIKAILHRFNTIRSACHQNPYTSKLLLDNIEQQLLTGIQIFTDEITRHEQLLYKMPEFNQKKIEFATQFHPSILITNHQSVLLVNFIDCYDKLVATIKLLHLAGCFSGDSNYYFHIKNIQKKANKVLSTILVEPLKKS